MREPELLPAAGPPGRNRAATRPKRAASGARSAARQPPRSGSSGGCQILDRSRAPAAAAKEAMSGAATEQAPASDHATKAVRLPTRVLVCAPWIPPHVAAVATLIYRLFERVNP